MFFFFLSEKFNFLFKVNKVIKEVLQFKDNLCNLEREYANKWQDLPVENQYYVLATDVERFNEWLIVINLYILQRLTIISEKKNHSNTLNLTGKLLTPD